MTDQELTRWAAEKVMKAKDIVLTPFGECHIIDKDNIWMTFDPIHDANHRDMVVERMREKGWCGKITWWANTNPIYTVKFYRFEPDKETDDIWDSLGRAVLLAAKAALEGE